jgi:hypothetical protein
MFSDDTIRSETRAQGRKIKRNNLVAASLSGAILVLISLRFFPHSVIGISAGFVAGLLYANGFEYVLHRFLLHSGHGIFCRQHMVHHTTLNSPEVARYVNFSSNPLGVVALFCANAIPFLLLQWIFRGGWGAGVSASFAIYYIAFEEIHWRTHMGGWLPNWLRPAARHHMLHHAHDAHRFNVFFPLFDWLLEPASLMWNVHHKKENPRL